MLRKFLDQLENHWTHFILALLVLTYAGLAKLFGSEQSEVALGLMAVVFILIGTAIWHSHRRRPVPKLDGVETVLKHPPAITIPSYPHELEQGISLVHRFFNPPGFEGIIKRMLGQYPPAIPPSVMKEAFKKNPYSGFSFCDFSGNVCGFAELWSLKHDRLHQLLDGEISENYLTARDFDDYSHQLRELYVAFIYPYYGKGSGADLPYMRDRIILNALFGMTELFEKTYLSPIVPAPSPIVLDLYGIDETRAGRELMEKLGFALDEEHTRHRVDGRRVFHLALTQQYLDRKRAQYGYTKRSVRVNIRCQRAGIISGTGDNMTKKPGKGQSGGVHISASAGSVDRDVAGRDKIAGVTQRVLIGEQTGEKIKILFVSANPIGTNHLKLDEEAREISSKIRAAKHRESLEFISIWAARPDDLLQALNEHKPHVVHFSGHGSPMEEIILLDKLGKAAKPVSKEALVSLFHTLKDNIRVVVLNACFSRPQAEAITGEIDCAIGMTRAIGDDAAITFAASFYRALGFGRSVKEAFDQGKTALLLEGIAEEKTPALMTRQNTTADSIVLINP